MHPAMCRDSGWHLERLPAVHRLGIAQCLAKVCSEKRCTSHVFLPLGRIWQFLMNSGPFDRLVAQNNLVRHGLVGSGEATLRWR